MFGLPVKQFVFFYIWYIFFWIMEQKLISWNESPPVVFTSSFLKMHGTVSWNISNTTCAWFNGWIIVELLVNFHFFNCMKMRLPPQFWFNRFEIIVISRETRGYRFQLFRLSVRLSVCLSGLMSRLYLRKYSMESF